jgi:hypothetical protein
MFYRTVIRAACCVLLTGLGGAIAQADPPRPTVSFDAASVSPDGKSVIFDFRYGQSDWKLAIIPTDPKSSAIEIVDTPAGMDWADPAWSPDGKTVTAVSRCRSTTCFEGSNGDNIWTFDPHSAQNFHRVTKPRPNIRRRYPFFGTTADELYWVIAGPVSSGLDLTPRSLVRGVGEVIIFPVEADDKRSSFDYTIYSIRPAGAGKDGISFRVSAALMAEPLGIFSKQGSLWHSLWHVSHGSPNDCLFRYRNGVATIMGDETVNGAWVEHSGGAYVYVQNVSPGPNVHAYLVRNGEKELLFKTRGYAMEFSASDDLSVQAYLATPPGPLDYKLFIYSLGRGAPWDAHVRERLTTAIENRRN